MDAELNEADVLSNEPETEHIQRLVVRPRVPWKHAPGQVARISLGAEREGVFAIASAPGELALTFLVKAKGTSAEPLMHLAAGESVALAGPYGAGFALPAEGSLLFAGAGTAVAAVHSGLVAALGRGHSPSQIAALIGVRSPRDLALRVEFGALVMRGVEVRVVASRPGPADSPDALWLGRIGRAQAHLEGLATPASWVFMAGSDAFEDDLERALAEAGVAMTRVQRNYRPDRRQGLPSSL